MQSPLTRTQTGKDKRQLQIDLAHTKFVSADKWREQEIGGIVMNVAVAKESKTVKFTVKADKNVNGALYHNRSQGNHEYKTMELIIQIN